MTSPPPTLWTERKASLVARGQRWLAKIPRGQFWSFFSGAIFFNFGFAVFFFFFNLYLLGLGRTERDLGLIGSFMAIGSIVGTIPAGLLAERFGLRATLLGGVLSTVVFAALRTCLLGSIEQLILAVLSGSTLCIWAVCLSPTVAELTTEQERPAAFSLMFASGIAVTGLGGFTAGRLPRVMEMVFQHDPMTITQSIRKILLFSCSAALLSLLPFSWLKLKSSTTHAYLPRLSNPFLARFLPAMAIWGLVMGSFAPFANVYFVHHFGLSLQHVGSIFAFSHLVQFVSILSAPLLFRRFGLTLGVVSTQLVTGGALALLAAAHSSMRASWIYWAYMAAQCMSEPGIYSLLMDRTPVEERKSASAATFFVAAAAQSIASAAMGATVVRFGYAPALAVIAGLAVMAAILFWRLSCNSDIALPSKAMQ